MILKDCLSRAIWAVFSFSTVSATGFVPQFKFQSYCGGETYGRPEVEDCHTLLEHFADARDNGLRFFDEEQIRVDPKGSWPGIGEVVGSSRVVPVVQLPRYYSLNSCNFALMSYAGGEGDHSGLGGTSWSRVNAGGTSMMSKCLHDPRDPSGGVVVIPSFASPNKAAVSLFMWQSGSYFDWTMNAFASSPAPMVPTPGNSLFLNWTSADASK